MEILKGLKEQCVDKLSFTGGKELEMTSFLTSGNQVRAILECHAHSYLGSRYVRDRCEVLERLTCSFQGRHRTDLVEIGKSGSNDMMFSGGE